MNIMLQFGKHYKVELRIQGFEGIVSAIQVAIWIGGLILYLTS